MFLSSLLTLNRAAPLCLKCVELQVVLITTLVKKKKKQSSANLSILKLLNILALPKKLSNFVLGVAI